jgi:hypothetical protein
VILSQFPKEHAMHERNTRLPYSKTVKKEDGRKPDAVFKVFVPDDKKFNKTVARMNSVKWWDWMPDHAKSETNCSDATMSALKAGGVPFTYVAIGTLMPEDVEHMLKQKDGTKGPGKNSWSVQSVSTDTIERLPGIDDETELPGSSAADAGFIGLNMASTFAGTVFLDGVQIK